MGCLPDPALPFCVSGDLVSFSQEPVVEMVYPWAGVEKPLPALLKRPAQKVSNLFYPFRWLILRNGNQYG
jgi:hypothetical protein